MDKQEFQQKLITFIADKGFVYGPEPTIYNGVAGFYSYGPTGKALKNNVEQTIRNQFNKQQFWEVECPTILPEVVWEASGHLGGFTDPLIKDEKGNIFRADKVIEEWAHNNNKEIVADHLSPSQLLEVIEQHNIPAPSGHKWVPNIEQHNLMLKTTVGTDTVCYNRPETATTTFLPFQQYKQFFRTKFPFGVFQIGKAYRNEISPRQHVIRGREFTQCEAQLFILEEQKNNFDKYNSCKDKTLPLWSAQLQAQQQQPQTISVQEARAQNVLKNDAYAWCVSIAYDVFVALGIQAKHIRLRQHHDDEKAFYADDAWDIEVYFNSYGWTEVCGIHDRTDYDLSVHSKKSGKELAHITDDGTRQTPHILEIAFGSDRPLLALLDNAYAPEGQDGKPELKLPYHIAPVQCAVLPLVNKEHILAKAQEVFAEVSSQYKTLFDKSGSVGKRYVRQDEIGTPCCITIDFDTLEDNTVTVRDRDTREQKRINVEDLLAHLQNVTK